MPEPGQHGQLCAPDAVGQRPRVRHRGEPVGGADEHPGGHRTEVLQGLGLVVLLQGQEVAPQRGQRGVPDERDPGHDRLARRAATVEQPGLGPGGHQPAGRHPGSAGRGPHERPLEGQPQPVLAHLGRGRHEHDPANPGGELVGVVGGPGHDRHATHRVPGEHQRTGRCERRQHPVQHLAELVHRRGARLGRRPAVAGLVERHDPHPEPRPEQLDDREPALVGEGPAVGQHHGHPSAAVPAAAAVAGHSTTCTSVPALSRTRCRTAPSGSRAEREAARRSGGA